MLCIFSYDCVKKAALQHWEDAGSSQPRVGSTSPLTLERLVGKRELLQPRTRWPASGTVVGDSLEGKGPRANAQRSGKFTEREIADADRFKKNC